MALVYNQCMPEKQPEESPHASPNLSLAQYIVERAIREPFARLQAGKVPCPTAGGMSDVKVVDTDGTVIPRTEVSHIREEQMEALLADVVDNVAFAKNGSIRNAFSRAFRKQ